LTANDATLGIIISKKRACLCVFLFVSFFSSIEKIRNRSCIFVHFVAAQNIKIKLLLSSSL